jgi:hypothetical protein
MAGALIRHAPVLYSSPPGSATGAQSRILILILLIAAAGPSEAQVITQVSGFFVVGVSADGTTLTGGTLPYPTTAGRWSDSTGMELFGVTAIGIYAGGRAFPGAEVLVA